MTRDEIVKMLLDLKERQIDEMRPHLGNMDSRGQICSKGNYHSGVAKGLELAISLVKTID